MKNTMHNIFNMPWQCRGYHAGLSSLRLGFKSRPRRLHRGSQLSLGERLAFNQAVAGSTPVGPANILLLFNYVMFFIIIYQGSQLSLGERLALNHAVAGSNPVGPARILNHLTIFYKINFSMNTNNIYIITCKIINN